ncbi:tripartite ATP-independent transporter DctP family solute receptor [Mumia flava]|uniref:Tripartite ATP-independent transporter DctP family solute receptor n=1 Tax=Mumia flava TaxID=1348852 RepID=A0A0B2BVD9_9ACTN|nr:DctP family TRAP transporter solute-binding subunit [Mumia flava]PJJ58039.1 tripartite ATP-independent transporter DctP family solute receptor [Mumia flava]
MSVIRKRKGLGLAAAAMSGALLITACGGDDDSGGSGGDESVTLSFANSYPDEHPHNQCGAMVVQETLADGDSGVEIEVFSNSQLGPDAERFTSVASGDIDIDIQGSSAISASFEEIGAMDAAYAFADADELFTFVDTDEFDAMAERLLEETGVRVLDVWYFGMRQFTANQPIRTPDDFDGLRMRFPDSPQYLMNAEALGAEATPVAFEEVFLALQQGTIDGQENPVPTIQDMNFTEVQSHVSLTGHQVGSVMAIISEESWQSLSSDQQEAVQAAISDAREGDRQCVEEAENDILAEWEESGTMTVVDDVDLDTFSEQAETFFNENYEGAQLELYQAIRESVGS